MSQDLTFLKPGEVQHILQQPPPVIPPEISQAREDFDEVRNNLQSIVTISSEAISSLQGLADQSQDWKYYDTLQKTLKTGVDANKELLQIHKTKKELGEAAGPKVVKNNLIMTSSELLDILGDNK